MATARLDLRIDEEIKTKAENASKVIAEHESMTVRDDLFDQFIAACETAKEPNAALKYALSFTKEQGIK